jgi:hypothetical protein
LHHHPFLGVLGVTWHDRTAMGTDATTPVKRDRGPVEVWSVVATSGLSVAAGHSRSLVGG